MKKALLLLLLAANITLHAFGQSTVLTLAQQNEDFAIFKGGLSEGHAGLYYFISPAAFTRKCDSIQKTFTSNAPVEAYYLKLRYLITQLCHGHTRINLPTNGWVNYRIGVLDSLKIYLPFEFIIINKKLVIKEDCSKEQLFPKYSVIKSIDGKSAGSLIKTMLAYIPADGINQTFKYYNLYNYFYFHYLYSLLYPGKKTFEIALEKNNTHYYIQGLTAKQIDSIYLAKNKQSISTYTEQLAYNAALPNKTAYLKIGSFYKGLIEGHGQHYQSFLDSAFASIRANNLHNLVLDLRDNEGGGDGYDNILLAYLGVNQAGIRQSVTVRGRSFTYNKYAVNLSDDVKGFIDNPAEFLRDDTSNYIKDKYVDMMAEGNIDAAMNKYKGKIIVLVNGGSFSAANAVIGRLYKERNTTGRQVIFVGEENGGDIYCGAACAGQGYTIKLPNTGITVDMPFLCFGELKKDYPKKRLPDYTVYNSISSLKQGKDDVLAFAQTLCK